MKHLNLNPMGYDHYQYCRKLADKLRGINGFLESYSLEDPADVDNRISRQKNPVLVAVTDAETNYSLNEDEQLNGIREFAILLLDHASCSQFDEIVKVQAECREMMRQIIARILIDAAQDDFGLGALDREKIMLSDVGPFGDNQYGVMVRFFTSQPEAYLLNPQAWI